MSYNFVPVFLSTDMSTDTELPTCSIVVVLFVPNLIHL